MKLSKIIKIALFNIIIIIPILVCTDYLQYKSFYNESIKNLSKEVIKANHIPTYRKSFNQVYSTNSIQSLNEYYHNGEWGYLRKPVIKNTNKPSILMFGCSFLYGSFLQNEQTFAYKLSEATGRSVYNKGVEAGGLAQMLYFLRDENFYKQIKQPPEYVIYLYISNHQKRLDSNMFPNPLWLQGYNLQYKMKNGELVIKQNWPAFIYKPFIIKKIYSFFDKINNKNTPKNINKRFELTNKILLESKQLLEEHYGNIKSVIIDYTYDYEF